MDALIVLFASGLISLFAAFTKKPMVVITTALLGIIATLAILACQFMHYGTNGTTDPNLVQLGYKGLHFDIITTVYSMAAVLLSGLMIGLGYSRFKENKEHTGEYIGLLMFSTVGALIMFSFTDMFMFFIGLEILSIPIYVMAGSRKDDLRSNEASLKYFLTGSFATGVLLFGIAWIYGATGTFDIKAISAAISNGGADNSMLLVGVLLILASFLFKVGAAPFHFWSPDVYDGAPAPVTGFMASVVKLAAFGAFLRLFYIGFGNTELKAFYGPIISAVIIITLFVGNLSALKQTGFKRMLAYSSITHVGYTLLTILTLESGTSFDLWFYMLSYGFATVGVIAMGVIVNDEEDQQTAMKGLLYRSPILGVVGLISLLSLAGIPPTAGFFGKFMVFSAAWEKYWWVVIIALINSAISIFYYLKMIGIIVSKEDAPTEKIKLSPLTVIVLLIAALGTLSLVVVTPGLLAEN